MAGRTFEINLDWIPPASLRGNSNAHWRTRHKNRKAMRNSGYFHFIANDGEALKKARITYHFIHNRDIDLDNIAYGMKAFVDGCVDAGLCKDDSPQYVTYGEHTFTKKPKTSRTRIQIEEIA